MLTLKACGSGWTPARDAYHGLANFPVSQTVVREHFCNYCATRISTVYHADVRPSRALTMERLADLRSSDVSPGSGQTSQYKRVSEYRSGEASYNRTSCHEPFLSTPSSRTSFSNLHYKYLERSFGFFREGLDLRQGEKLLVKFSVVADLTIDPSVYFGGCAADLASSWLVREQTT